MDDYVDRARRIFNGTRYEASDEDVKRLADNMLLLENRGLGNLNQRLLDSVKKVSKIWETIAEHNFAVLLVSQHCSAINIRYEPDDLGLQQPIDFKVDMGDITYWLQMKKSSTPEGENRQKKMIGKIREAAKEIKVGKFFGCYLSDDFKEDSLKEFITFISNTAASAPEEESLLFTGKKGETAKIEFWSPGETTLSELTLGYAGNEDMAEITGQASQQIRGSLFNAAGAFTWKADERNINLIIMEADNKRDIQICEAVFGMECFNVIGDKHSWYRNNDGFFADSGFSQKVVGVIAIKRKQELNVGISSLSPDEVVARLSPHAKKICDNMTPEEIKKALEWKSPGPIAAYSQTLYVNERFNHFIEAIKKLLRFDKIVHSNMRPLVGKSNFD